MISNSFGLVGVWWKVLSLIEMDYYVDTFVQFFIYTRLIQMRNLRNKLKDHKLTNFGIPVEPSSRYFSRNSIHSLRG